MDYNKLFYDKRNYILSYPIRISQIVIIKYLKSLNKTFILQFFKKPNIFLVYVEDFLCIKKNERI